MVYFINFVLLFIISYINSVLQCLKSIPLFTHLILVNLNPLVNYHYLDTCNNMFHKGLFGMHSCCSYPNGKRHRKANYPNDHSQKSEIDRNTIQLPSSGRRARVSSCIHRQASIRKGSIRWKDQKHCYVRFMQA